MKPIGCNINTLPPELREVARTCRDEYIKAFPALVGLIQKQRKTRMDNTATTVEICTICNHLPQDCLGHHINPVLIPHNRKAGKGGGDGYIGPTRRVAIGSDTHRAAVAAPIRASKSYG